MSTPSLIPALTLRDVLATKIHVTDEQLARLAAVDRVQILKAMVHEAIENLKGLNLLWDDKVVVLMYREWRDSSKFDSGVFHCKIPNFQQLKSDLKKRLEAEGESLMIPQQDVKGICGVCDKSIASSEDYFTDNYGIHYHDTCLSQLLQEKQNDTEKTKNKTGNSEDIHRQDPDSEEPGPVTT